MKKLLALALVLFTMTSCDVLMQIAEEGAKGASSLPPSESEISTGLKEALRVGITNAVSSSSAKNGFLNNSLIKIPFPPEAERAANTLRDLGMGNMVDQFVETLNHGAEQASAKATPIFVNAITKMSFSDVFAIYRGDTDAATQYLKRTTGDELKAAFRPVIKDAITKVELTKYWNPIASNYNRIPFVQKVNPNLEDYVLDQTLNGLFLVVAQEEAKIRLDPAARVSSILKKVFGYKG
tara:strand:+ start:1466 stop:2179 length:714 start_codon:yes stop_codon:yes gene_type:complete